MNLKVLRYNSSKDFTLGMLMDTTNGVEFLCYTLEDEHRDSKVHGDTRVPSGTYNITLRTVGSFHSKYSTQYKPMHKGMLWVRDVPGFEYILIHTGNTDEDTAGCLLVGVSSDYSKGFIGGSVTAYKQIYPRILSALTKGEKVTITYENYDSV